MVWQCSVPETADEKMDARREPRISERSQKHGAPRARRKMQKNDGSGYFMARCSMSDRQLRAVTFPVRCCRQLTTRASELYFEQGPEGVTV